MTPNESRFPQRVSSVFGHYRGKTTRHSFELNLELGRRRQNEMKLPESRELLEKAVNIAGELFGPDSREATVANSYLVLTLIGLGEFEPALNLIRQGVENMIRINGDDSAETKRVESVLGLALYYSGKTNSSAELVNEAHAVETDVVQWFREHSLAGDQDMSTAERRLKKIQDLIAEKGY